ncbi:MAG: hypothetical protein H6741_27970 [Alphaproteobacteria bacterium]|nr:hypothetical protein [Alphaproteobacteria bacterium]MCB9796553.1 hypothetical protein [Alphaproteobacteria bacterium]
MSAEGPTELLRQEVERNLPHTGGMPWMVMGGGDDARLAVVRDDLEPATCARVERALASEPGVQWTALSGEAVLPSAGGVLRHVFIRIQRSEDWVVLSRPFLHQGGELTWLGAWSEARGQGAPSGPLRSLFPPASPGPVRFVRGLGELPEANDVQPLPEGATQEDIARLAGIWLESFFFAHGFVPPAVVRVVAGQLEVRLLPRTGPSHAASDLAIQVAQEPDTEAVGVYSRAKDQRVQPPAEQIRLRLEYRDGPALVWRRRFRIVAPNTARWLDPAGEVIERGDTRIWFP